MELGAGGMEQGAWSRGHGAGGMEFLAPRPMLHAKSGAHGRSCTCTRPLLRRLSLLLDYAGMKLAALGGFAAPAAVHLLLRTS